MHLTFLRDFRRAQSASEFLVCPDESVSDFFNINLVFAIFDLGFDRRNTSAVNFGHGRKGFLSRR